MTDVTHPRVSKPPLDQQEVVRRLRSVLGTHGIRRMVLFGSFARGTQTAESDVDLIVVGDYEQRFLDRYTELLPMLHRLLQPHAVEPLIYNQREYDQLRSRPTGVVVTAHQEGIVLDV